MTQDYAWVCNKCSTSYSGQKLWVEAQYLRHIRNYHLDPAPAFTGFDGIPDWTPERERIAVLEKIARDRQALVADFLAISAKYNRMRDMISTMEQNASYWYDQGYRLAPLAGALMALRKVLSAHQE